MASAILTILASLGSSTPPRAQVTEFHWKAHYREHAVPSDVSLVDTDGDGRAELVRIRVRVHQPKGHEWVVSGARLGLHPERFDAAVILGGSVGTLALDARIRGPRILQTMNTRVSADATLEFEFDAEEVRLKLAGRPGALLFEVNRVMSADTASPDGDRYRCEIPALPVAGLGWLPGRLLGVGAAIHDGRVEFSTRIEADRDADCPIRASVFGRTRSIRHDSLIVVPVRAGVTAHTFSIRLPRDLPAELDSVLLQLDVTDIRGPLFPGKFWQREARPLPPRPH